MIFLLIVTLTSLLLATVMSVIAWRIAGDERRRSDARVATLSEEIHGAAPARIAIVAQAGASRRATRQWDEALELRPSAVARATNLFAARETRSGSRPFAVLAGGALVVGAVVAMAVLFGGGVSRAPRSASPAAAAAADALELVALGHERVGDGLTVRGIVRNPASGAAVDRLTAVVFLFTSDGGFLASGRAAVESPALGPGGESTFTVTVPRAGDAGRYRVSFRTDEHMVPHVDRRHEQS